VKAQFRLAAEVIEEVRRAADTQAKHEPVFTVEVKDETGEVVAEVQKTIYVKKKPATT
jgi:preprotein translocase subunit SecE